MRRTFCGLFAVCLILQLIACTGENPRPEIPSTLPKTVSAIEEVPSSQTESESATGTPTLSPVTSTPTIEPLSSEVSTMTPDVAAIIQPDASAVPVICSQIRSFVDIQEATNNDSWRLMDFQFSRNDELVFLMWSNRPYPGPSPTPFSDRPPEPNRSRRVLLIPQIWNLVSGELTEMSLSNQDAITSPCDGDCPLEVVSASPGGNTQLLQVTEAPSEYQGLWLGNEESLTNLVPYVPVYSRWEWSSDGQLLWLIYTLQDLTGETFGLESMVVDISSMEAPVVLYQSSDSEISDAENRLSPIEYEIAFSPEEKTVLAYEYVDSSESLALDDQLEVYHFDVSQSPPLLLSTHFASYPFLIDWSDTLRDFVILEFTDTGATFYTLSLDLVFDLPLEALREMPDLVGIDGQIRTDLESEIDLMALYRRIERVEVALDRQSLILMSSNEVWAFSCSE